MSGVPKPLGLDLKSTDKGEQPIDLAPRAAHMSKPIGATHSLRGPQIDVTKSAFSAVNLRMPGGPRPVLQSPVTVASGQQFSMKPGSSAAQLSALRHMATTTAHSSQGSMASIIRGGAHSMATSQMGHQAAYSSHVPRGPAAVASISTAPKSALATPMLRSSVNPTSMTSHIPVGARASALVPTRPSFTPLPRSSPSVMDLQKSAHSGGAVQLGLSSSRDGRTSLGHTAICKPLHMSQPIVHSLHQAPDKSFKCITTSSSALEFSSHGISSTSSIAPTPATTVVTPHPQIVSHPGPVRQTNLTTMSLVTLAPALPSQVSPQMVSQPLHTLSSPSSLATTVPSLFTVVPSKAPTAHVVSTHGTTLATALVVGQNRVGVTSTPSMTTSGPNSSLAAAVQANLVSRPITTTVSIHPPSVTVPTTKLFGQTLTVPGGHTPSHLESSGSTEPPSSGLFVAQPSSRTLAAPPSTTSPLPATMVLSDSRADRGGLSQLSGTSYAVPTAYVYESYPIQGAIAVHPYATSAPGMPPMFPTTTIRPARPHGVACSTAPVVQPPQQQSHMSGSVRPVMVAVDSNLRPHVTLQTSFAPTAHSSSGGESVASTTMSTLVAPSASYTTPSNLLSPTHGATPPNHNTSPRPSILRKRTFEGMSGNVKKNLLASLPGSEPASPHPEVVSAPSTLSPKAGSDSQQESSNSSQSSNNTPENSRQPTPAVTIKQEPVDTCEGSGLVLNGSPASLPMPTVEASPRKKPRKQLLSANELLDTHSTDGEDEMDSKEAILKEKDDEMRCITFCKRPAMSLLTTYSHSWKSRHNHFARHSDVKPKDDKKLTVNDLANQKGVLQKANGWKVFHLTSQMEEVFFLEDTVYGKLSQLLDFIENKPPAIQSKPLNPDEERILSKISDLVKGNLQRSKIVQDQVTEAKQQMHKVLEHKPRIVEIIGKYVSKRPLKKREKM
ncbi:histone deacetylase complex subunit SAP130-A-like isoform X3 [Ornithodoros turicata]|uniref:histone deacetylase complex subunit SAP130-A-like isoform X3 n=1 Tax=Ornithodoros turicata TaxID=34597 RepID=UPI003139F172